MRRTWVVVLAMIVVIGNASPTFAATGASGTEEPSHDRVAVSQRGATTRYDPSRIMVKFNAGVSDREVVDLALERGLTETLVLSEIGWHSFQVRAGADPIQMADSLVGDPRIAESVPIAMAGTFDAFPNTPPNDPKYPPGACPCPGYQWNLPDVNALGAWQIAGGGSTTHFIAIVDSGIYTHPDLGQLQGKCFTNNCTGWGDVCTAFGGHGTKVAGIAAAFTNNGAAVSGMAYNAGIRSYRIADLCGDWTIEAAAAAVNWAVQKGAWVINMSDTIYGILPQDAQPLHDAIISAYNNNIPVVVASGNNNFSRFDAPTDPTECATSCAVYPALWTEVITVGGTMIVNGNTRRLTFGTGEDEKGSNYGLPGLDLSAPGLDIWSTKLGGGTISDSGTSFAAPLVAGIVYLIRSQHPTWTVAQIKSRLWNTADKRGIDAYSYNWKPFCGGQSAELGCGVLDADSAVQ